MNIDFKVKKTGLLAMPPGAPGKLYASNMSRALNSVFTKQRDSIRRKMSPVKRHAAGTSTPHLRDSVRLQRATISTLKARLYSDDPRWVFYEEDTRPHLITPGPGGKAVAFKIGGENIVVVRVHHPGTRGKRLFAKAQKYFDLHLPVALRRAQEATVRGKHLEV